MSDMYDWLDIVSESIKLPFRPGETVQISKDHGGGVGRFVDFNIGHGKAIVDVKGDQREYILDDLSPVVDPTVSYYDNNTAEQRYDEVQGGEHWLPDKPELQPGQMVVIDGMYSAGNGKGYGVFQSYSLDGQSVLCNVDSKVLTFHVDNVKPAQEEIESNTFGETGNDGSMSPMSIDRNADSDDRMEDLEKWMQVVTNGRFRKTDAGKAKWNT